MLPHNRMGMNWNEVGEVNLRPQFEPLRTNLGQQIAQHLRERIYRMDIQPGSRLGVGQIADQLGVSRSPVRDAFHMLVAEGLVEALPSGGYRVFEPTRKYIDDVFVMRRSLELTAVRLSVQNLDVERVAELQSLWQRLESIDEQDSVAVDEHIVADNLLHQSLAEMSQNHMLQESLDRIISVVSLIRRWQYSGGVPRQHLALTAREHLAVLDAVLAGNAEGAVAAMGAHLDSAYGRSLARLEALAAQAADRNGS